MTDDAEISPLVQNRGRHSKLLFGRKQQEPRPAVWTSVYTDFNLVGRGEKKAHFLICNTWATCVLSLWSRKTCTQLKQLNISAVEQINSIKCGTFWP